MEGLLKGTITVPQAARLLALSQYGRIPEGTGGKPNPGSLTPDQGEQDPETIICVKEKRKAANGPPFSTRGRFTSRLIKMAL